MTDRDKAEVRRAWIVVTAGLTLVVLAWILTYMALR